jgi:integrase
VNPERKALYQLCWHLGASQGDIANLKGEDVDWTNGTVSFVRKKTGVPVLVHLGTEALNLFKDLPAEGVLFPYLSSVRAGDRATEFKQRCQQLGIQGVTLHSYRYAWAERAKTVGYAGWIALHAGIAGRADAILIPEIPYDIAKVAAHIKRKTSGRHRQYSIVVVAEGVKPLGGG